MSTSMQPIIIKKKKGHGHGHHGGSWKVAFADFMTAMMAFFLLMWLMAAANDPQKKAIAGYFNDAGGGLVGPGGANTGVIQLDNPQSSHEEMKPPTIKNEQRGGTNELNNGEGVDQPTIIPMTDQQLREQYEKQEKESLEKLKEQLQNELNKSDSVLREVRDQIIIDYTGLGLRIQIVDKEQRPMFDLGKANLKNYSLAVLEALAPLLDSVPNHLSITGHTDATKYGGNGLYSNWELSADRANSARRALLEGGYPEDKIINVQGMGSAAPYNPEAPYDPINRRIAILVLKKSVEEALLGKTGVSSEHVIESGGDALLPNPEQPPQTTPTEASPAAPSSTTP
ncbi:MAG TPA: flagellar motor protein MotB [Spongiibacteraceae bacterium]|nr:flagellar motor protein MotB [Spongiibacteraceae bacterium]